MRRGIEPARDQTRHADTAGNVYTINRPTSRPLDLSRCLSVPLSLSVCLLSVCLHLAARGGGGACVFLNVYTETSKGADACKQVREQHQEVSEKPRREEA